MRAACMRTPGVIEVADFPIPDVSNGQVLVEMKYASICGSDVHVLFDGFHTPEYLGKPGYPGHEGVGTVVESRSRAFTVGTLVLTVPHGQRGGCFAEYQVVDDTHVIALDAGLKPEQMLLAQQLGTTVFGMKKFLPRDGRSAPRNAAIVGAGSAGLFYLQQLIARGVEVTISDLNSERLAIAGRLGASRLVLEPVETLAEVVFDSTAGIGADLVIEAAGYDLARKAAVDAARVRGTIGFFGYPELKGNAPFPVERAFRKSLTMEWVSMAQQESGLTSFREAVDLIADGAIEIDYCLEKMYDLKDAAVAFDVARHAGHGAAKVSLSMAGTPNR